MKKIRLIKIDPTDVVNAICFSTVLRIPSLTSVTDLFYVIITMVILMSSSYIKGRMHQKKKENQDEHKIK